MRDVVAEPLRRRLVIGIVDILLFQLEILDKELLHALRRFGVLLAFLQFGRDRRDLGTQSTERTIGRADVGNAGQRDATDRWLRPGAETLRCLIFRKTVCHYVAP